MTESDIDPNCTFCKIVMGKEPAYFIKMTRYSLAFLDKQPIADGHILVIPLKHRENIEELKENEMSDLFKLIVEVGKSIKKFLIKEKKENDQEKVGYNVISNIGKAAGQTVFHCHFHVVPRFTEDGIMNIGTENANRKNLTDAFRISYEIINGMK